MKKFSATILSLFYLLTATGLGVTVHTCDDIITAIMLSDNAPSCCCDDEEEMKESCCNDELIQLNVSDEQLLSEQTLVNFENTFVSNHYHFASFFESQTTHIGFSATDAPPPPKASIRILTCSLTFYG